jgi:23S rRNA-/tRNA-specific pseudouridylate synthase
MDKTAVLARVTLHTGRTHQIRLHMSHANLPVLSDPLYGPHVRWDRAVPCEDASTSDVMPAEVRAETWGGALWLGRQALHARRLTLRHPGTGAEMTFEAAMPEDMRGACVALGLDPDAA